MAMGASACLARSLSGSARSSSSSFLPLGCLFSEKNFPIGEVCLVALLLLLLLLLFGLSSTIGEACLVAMRLLLLLLVFCLFSLIGEVCLFALRLLLLLLRFSLFSPIGEVCLFALRFFPSSCEDPPAIASVPSVSRHARDGWESVHRRMAC